MTIERFLKYVKGSSFSIPTGRGAIIFSNRGCAKNDFKVDLSSIKENIFTMNEDENSDNLFQ